MEIHDEIRDKNIFLCLENKLSGNLYNIVYNNGSHNQKEYFVVEHNVGYHNLPHYNDYVIKIYNMSLNKYCGT